MLPTEADISIVGGSRGGGKSYVLLMNALYDITNPNFRAIIFRKDLDDLSDIIDTSHELYDEYGTFNRAKNDLVSARVALMGLKPRQKGDNDMFTDPQLYSDDPESERPKGYTYISC